MTHMAAYVQKSIAENFNPGSAASGFPFKENRPTASAAYSSISDQRCSISGGGIFKERLATNSTADSGTIVNEGATSGARREIEGLQPKFCNASLCSAGRGSIVDKGAISRG